MPAYGVTLIALGFVLAGAVVPRWRLDLMALLALCTLVIGGVLDAREACLGFGSTTLLTVACMFVLAEALQRTGAASGIGRLVERRAKAGTRGLLVALLPLVMVLSGVMSNTGVVVLLLPIVLASAQRGGTSPSRVLLPLSFASITGGVLTLVGTTTTLLVDGMLRQAGEPGMGLLEILPIGLVFCVITLIYLVLCGPLLLPERVGLVTPVDADTTRQYMTDIEIGARSRFLGKTLRDVPAFSDRVRVLQLLRGESMIWPPFDQEILQAHDTLRVKAEPEDIVTLLSDRDMRPADGGDKVSGLEIALGEVMVAPASRLVGSTVEEAAIRDRFGVTVLAVQRRGAHLRRQLRALPLAIGDVLLVEGEPDALDRLARQERDLLVLGGRLPTPPARSRAPWAIAISATALLLASLGVMPLVVAVLLGAAGVVVAHCLTATQAYRALNLQVLVILGAMLALGRAASESGLAAGIAGGLVAAGEGLGPRGILAMLYLTTLVLTELVSNAGTAGIMVPISLSIAASQGLDPRPFIMAVTIAASCSFLTPVGYQTNLLVYGPGGYRLQDYLRLGAPLSLMLWGVAVWLIPIFYPF